MNAEPHPNTPTIITAKEAAALLGVHHTTLYDAARNGEIPCRRVGRRFIFTREGLIDWLRGRDSSRA
ncbi:MAG TPA: helix-turn-helix domain-containing protein [Enhygromyxa sp.]|nr:helix-turn-helix domain-containing protein [Enhygromyxa sp.]